MSRGVTLSDIFSGITLAAMYRLNFLSLKVAEKGFCKADRKYLQIYWPVPQSRFMSMPFMGPVSDPLSYSELKLSYQPKTLPVIVKKNKELIHQSYKSLVRLLTLLSQQFI